MNTIAVLGVVIALGLVGSEWLNKYSISLPIVFVFAGLVLGPHALGWLDLSLSEELINDVTKITLGIILFADASTLRARRVAAEAALETRLLSVGLLLSIGLGSLLGFILFPDEPLGILLLLGAALAPTDAALGLPIFTNPHIPSRIRQSLNVESGLNDGIVTPFVMLFISLVVSEGHEGRESWLGPAIEEIVIAVLIGVVVGTVGGWLIKYARERHLTSPEMSQLAFLAVAAIAFFSSGNWDGNSFIASFVGGLFAGSVLRHEAHETAVYTEVTGSGLSYLVWVVFGAIFVPLAIDDAFSWNAVIFAIAALTLMRMIPVSLAMLGSGLRRDTVAMMGWFGPRGLASVGFLLTAVVIFQRENTQSNPFLAAMTWTILLSVVLHGLTAGPLGNWYGKRLSSAGVSIAEFHTAGDSGEEGGPLTST